MVNVLYYYSLNRYFVCKWCYSPGIKSFLFGPTLNPDSSIFVNCCYSPWILAILRCCFVEDTFFLNKYFISNFMIVVNTSIVLALVAKISQWLPVFSNLMPVSYKWNVKEHVSSKNSGAWWGFKYCMIGRANCPCHVVKENINIIGGNWVDHINFRCA